MFRAKRDSLPKAMERHIYILWCTGDVKKSLISENLSENASNASNASNAPQNITDDQMAAMLDLMTFYLGQCNTSVYEMNLSSLRLFLLLLLVLMSSNQKDECEAWMRAHMSELKSLRSIKADSILHLIITINDGDLPQEPIVRMLVEEGKMDVNVTNVYRQTPLHWLSSFFLTVAKGRHQNIIRLAELLINNGAHMDAVDVNGKEASHGFAKGFPQWSFNVNLKCLAARAVIKYGYEKFVPKTLIPFIQSHKPDDRKDSKAKKN